MPWKGINEKIMGKMGKTVRQIEEIKKGFNRLIGEFELFFNDFEMLVSRLSMIKKNLNEIEENFYTKIEDEDEY